MLVPHTGNAETTARESGEELGTMQSAAMVDPEDQPGDGDPTPRDSEETLDLMQVELMSDAGDDDQDSTGSNDSSPPETPDSVIVSEPESVANDNKCCEHMTWCECESGGKKKGKDINYYLRPEMHLWGLHCKLCDGLMSELLDNKKGKQNACFVCEQTISSPRKCDFVVCLGCHDTKVFPVLVRELSSISPRRTRNS